MKTTKLNLNEQTYNGITLKLIKRDYIGYKAKRFMINNSNQSIWIPNSFLLDDGTIKTNVNLNFIFNKAQTQHKIALSSR